MNLDAHFPRYTTFDPLVPVWCVTPQLDRCFHRFFDTSPISPSGRYLAVFRMPSEDKFPESGAKGEVWIIDLETGAQRLLMETAGWEPQLGANINWGGSDEELFFNDVDVQNWQPFAWKFNPLTGAKQRLNGTVYHASPDGRWLISANLCTMQRTQPGYGANVPEKYCRWNVGATDDDGFYLTDTQTGNCRLLISIHEIFERATPNIQITNIHQQEIYGFHCKFNPQGDRLMLSLRWYPAGDSPKWNMFKQAPKEVRYAWVTMKLDGSELHCAVGPEEWEKGGHHATWFPDGKRISMNLTLDRQTLRFVQVNADGCELKTMNDGITGSGHPTVHPDGRHLLTDTYTFEPVAFGDGTIPLRWIDFVNGTEQTIVRIHSKVLSSDITMRCDPHPAWDRTWRYVVFNAFVNGTRQVFLADMKELLE